MRILETERDTKEAIISALTSESAGSNAEIEVIVKNIISDVRARGDKALYDYGRKFDSPDLKTLIVTEDEFDEAYKKIDSNLLDAIRKAKSNIETFHRKQLQKSWIDTQDDFTYGQIVRPINKVGFYAPGGLAPYPSTVLMTAIPGIVAGVEELVMCAPPQKDGNMHPAMLVAARECGVSKVFKVGGAQAIAAMTYGTESVPKVDKIVGPGNAFVAEAKRQVFGIVGIDQIAGPSEILILADETSNPAYVAADILSQAEHAKDSRCILVTQSRTVADAVLKEVKKQTQTAPRAEYINASLDCNGIVVIASSMDECIELANIFAPEHLEIALAEPWEVLKKIKNAGTIMLGNNTPVPLCDFAAGPNHTLPTNGTARFSSALSVDDYIKKSGLLSYTKEGLSRIASTVIEIANAEGFDAHANTIKIRLKNDGGPHAG